MIDGGGWDGMVIGEGVGKGRMLGVRERKKRGRDGVMGKKGERFLLCL